MKALFIIALVCYGVYHFRLLDNLKSPTAGTSTQKSARQDDTGKISKAFEYKQGDLQVRASGKVIKVLQDDLKGSKHQRFILKLFSGQTLLIAHNIDLAPRIASLKNGDTVEFYGEYEWNAKGGVIHWTHHDPRGKHIGGWLKHRGKVYK